MTTIADVHEHLLAGRPRTARQLLFGLTEDEARAEGIDAHLARPYVEGV